MGCDIHFYVEKRVDGVWVTGDIWTQGKYDEPGEVSNRDNRFYDGRNYDLFAILANVRNGYGFAGVNTGDGFVPIAEPRGIPEDACPEYLKEVESWGNDGHSHQWLTLQELLEYDWTQKAKHRGWVDPLEWARWRDYGKPDGWSGGVEGSAVKHCSPEDFEQAWAKVRTQFAFKESYYPSSYLHPNRDEGAALEAFKKALDCSSPYCQVEWVTPYYDSIEHFWGSTIPRLLRLGKPEDVRCVFFFDN